MSQPNGPTHAAPQGDEGPGNAVLRAIEDLRFTIGLFFLLISGILLVAAFLPLDPRLLPPGARASGINLNLRAGLLMLVFSAVMLTLFVRQRRRP